MAEEPQTVSTGNADTPSAEKAARGGVCLRNRYHIELGQPLPELDMPNAKAYACTDRRSSGRSVYALVVTGPLPARIRTARALMGLECPGLLHLIDWGVVDWPKTGGRTVVVIYERPLGGRVMSSMTGSLDPLPATEFIKHVFRPLLNVMAEFAGRGIMHRAIRPTNFYWLDRERTRIVLGDCVTSPPAYDQPNICEPIESAMANREGRGPGNHGCDLYSLGVSMVALSVGRLSQARLSEDDVLNAKINTGSFATVVAHERVPLDMIEVIRGLLMDDPKKRWAEEDIHKWLGGRRGNAIPEIIQPRSQRPFLFQDKEYFTSRALAHAFACNWEAAAEPLLDGRVENWVRRGLDQSDIADMIRKTLSLRENAPTGDPDASKDHAMATILSLIDPLAPIRYKSYRFHPDAIGVAVACALAGSGDVRVYLDMVQRRFVHRWVEAQPDPNASDLGLLEGRYRRLRAYLVDAALGSGLERFYYEANPDLPCLSPLVKDMCVLCADDLLPALEQVSASADQTQLPTDRHITAFVAARYGQDSDVRLRAVNSTDRTHVVLGSLGFLGVLQWKFGPDALPNLSAWFSRFLAPVIESYHSRDRRKRIEKALPALVKKGSLPRLYHLLDDAEERKLDAEGFLSAQREYEAATSKVEDLKAGKFRASREVEKKAQYVAAFIAMFVGFSVVALTGVAYL